MTIFSSEMVLSVPWRLLSKGGQESEEIPKWHWINISKSRRISLQNSFVGQLAEQSNLLYKHNLQFNLKLGIQRRIVDRFWNPPKVFYTNNFHFLFNRPHSLFVRDPQVRGWPHVRMLRHSRYDHLHSIGVRIEFFVDFIRGAGAGCQVAIVRSVIDYIPETHLQSIWSSHR